VLADVRFGVHYGLKPDIARGPKSARSGRRAVAMNNLAIARARKNKHRDCHANYAEADDAR